MKNGDRWTVLGLHENGDLSVQHTRHGRTVRLPGDYVQASTELGYACTVHTAQGVTADTMHGLATGSESRQQLYTMMTRGSSANHVYLEVVGDGDPHSVIHPTLVRPLTGTDILEQILARDAAPASGTSLIRAHADPALRLGEASQRYLDSLHTAAHHLIGPGVIGALDTTVDTLLLRMSQEPDWSALRTHLLLLAANGTDPVSALREAANGGELSTNEDRAAVLDWRLDATGIRNAGTGPLPWMPAIPIALTRDPHWGPYLTQRAHLVTDLADTLTQQTTTAASSGSLPAWADNGLRPDIETLTAVEVWRAAMQVDPADRRPTGPPQLQKAAGTYQRRLNRRATGDHTPALKEWRLLLHTLAPQVRADEFTPLLAERLATMSRTGLPAHQLLRHAAHAGGPLPDEHPAAALWWRLAPHLTPAVAPRSTPPTPVSEWPAAGLHN